MRTSREAPLIGQLMYMKTVPLIWTYMYSSVNCLWKGCWCVEKTIPLIRTYMHNSREAPLRRRLVCMKKMSLIRTYMHNHVQSWKMPLRGLLRRVHALLHFRYGWWSWTGLCHTHLFCTVVSRVCEWLLNKNLIVGGKRKEISREINCPSLGFHAILDMRDTSLAGRTHSRILDKVE